MPRMVEKECSGFYNEKQKSPWRNSWNVEDIQKIMGEHAWAVSTRMCHAHLQHFAIIQISSNWYMLVKIPQLWSDNFSFKYNTLWTIFVNSQVYQLFAFFLEQSSELDGKLVCVWNVLLILIYMTNSVTLHYGTLITSLHRERNLMMLVI